MRDRYLKRLAQLHAHYPGRIALIAALITLGLLAAASRLSLTMRWSDLLPAKDKRTVEFNRIIDDFRTASSIVIVLQGDESQIKTVADSLAPLLLTLTHDDGQEAKPLIQRVDYRLETDFLKRNGLLLMKKDDLENSREVFTDPNLMPLIRNINTSLEKEYVGKSESISTREKEDEAVNFLDGIEYFASTLQGVVQGEKIGGDEASTAVDRLLIGDPYFLSYDKSTLILNAVPYFAVTDLDLVVIGTQKVQAELNKLLKRFPGVKGGLTGMVPLCHDEMKYSEKSLGYTSFIAGIAILLLLIFSLRMWVAPIFAMITLLLGIIWAIGITAILVGQLNIMTQMMAVILLGLGIDFSIHIISGFTEHRALGNSIQESLEHTFLTSGRGIITGGLTTAMAFLTLIVSSSRGMKEMGIVTGTGLLAILAATFIILPVFLVMRERRLDKKTTITNRVKRDISFRFLGRTGSFLAGHYRFTLIAAAVLTIFFLVAASRITFDQNYMNIEAKGLTSIALQDTVLHHFDLSMDYALVSTDSPEYSGQLAKTYREMSSVARTDDISLYLPSAEEQNLRLPLIRNIRESIKKSVPRATMSPEEVDQLSAQLQRLEENIIEIQDMAYLGGQDKIDRKCSELVGYPQDQESPNLLTQLLETIKKENKTTAAVRLAGFQRQFSPLFKKTVFNMCSIAPITLNDLPVSILDQYSNSTRDRFLVTIYPARSIWTDASFLHRFTDDLEQVDDRATGMPPVFRALIDIIGRDGQIAMALTVLIVFLLLLADFRSFKDALTAMIPLLTGTVWMVGLMKLTGQQFTVMNVMGLPMIIGIGIDDGVHVVHRWISEKRGNIDRVFSSTGKAILLTTLTTMLAFGSLIFSIWRGFGQLGGALFVGVAACFLTTVFILSGIMGMRK